MGGPDASTHEGDRLLRIGDRIISSRDSSVSQRIQDAFVFLSITDEKFLKIARRSIKSKWFSSQVTEDIIDLCYSYLDQFGAAPCDHLHDELVRSLNGKDNDTKQLYIEYLTRLQGIEPPNREYVISRINSFVKAREFEESAIKFVQLTKEEKFDEARNLMMNTLRAGIQEEDVGIKYLESEPTYTEEGEDDGDFLIPVGIPTIDERLPRGLRRTDFVVILGGYKAGKSWACNHFGKEAMLRGKRVLHISHENSAKEVEMRYDMSFGAMRSFGDNPYVQVEEIDDDGNLLKSERVEVPSVFDVAKVIQIRKRIARFGGELIIKKYPMGQCDIHEIRRYLDYLETFEGFIPDVVINDYVEKMKLPTGEWRRDGINEVYMQSKGIADERGLLMITVSQATRDALEREFLGPKDFAEDIRKLGDVDLAIGISRTRAQAETRRMQLYIIANRHGQMNFGCKMANNFDIGQFCVADWALKQLKTDEIED